jgi:hypothetical protein
MTELTVVAAPYNEGERVLAMISEAAGNPAVDDAKLERLLNLKITVEKRAAELAYIEAFAEMQPDLPVIGERGGIKDRAGNVQSTYARWEDINEAIKPVLKKHKFALSFSSSQVPGEQAVTITGTLRHGHHTESTSLTLPLDLSGSKNGVQGVGSTVSYGKRYTAGMLLNLTSRHEDDGDTDGVVGSSTVTDEQVATLEALIDKAKADMTKFLKAFKVASLEDLPAKDYARAEAALEAKIKAAKVAA